jgi:CheY-like chemotaxis protein
MVAEFQPDYLLTDVLMPRMNGVELAIAVSKILPYAKILLFSGQAGISDILLHGFEQGYEFELVAKPLHPIKLIERLQRMP